MLQACVRNMASGPICGAPGISLRLRVAGGALPVGLELDGRANGDLELLSLAMAVEAALASG